MNINEARFIGHEQAKGDNKKGGNVRLYLLLGLLALSALTTGCDVYRTSEGIGILGPYGGYFLCSDNTDCSGI